MNGNFSWERRCKSKFCRSGMTYIINKLRKHKLSVLMLGGSTVLRSTFALGMAAYSKYVFDGIGSGLVSFWTVLLVGLGVTAWGAMSLLLKNCLIDSLVSRVSYEMRYEYMASVVHCPAGKVKDMGEGRVLTDYSQNIGAVMDLVRSGLDLVIIPFEMVISLVYLYLCNWILAMVVLLAFPVVMLSGKFIGKQIQKISSSYMAHDDNVMNLITRMVKGIEVIKVHGYQDTMLREFQEQISGQLDLNLKRTKYNGVFSGITDFFMGLPFIIVYAAAVLLVVDNGVTVGTLTLFLQLLNKITVPFVAYSNVLVHFKGAKVSVDRLVELISGGGESDEPLRGFRGVSLEHVDFSYQEGNLLLKDCSLSLENGKYYGIIGGNGSGKSTICKLLMNLYQPVSGKVSYVMDPRKKNKVVYIEDKPAILFDDIIRNIVVEGEPDQAKLERVLEETELWTKTVDNIGEKRASELSAGLLQRMVIARALYHLGQEDILVIDEGFSALDAENRTRMYRLVKRYQKEYHLLVMDITHNMGEMDRFDRVIWVEDGRVQLRA